MIEITEFRNAKYFNETIIDCEINHPEYGWMPFSCNPIDKGSTVDVEKLYKELKASNPTAYTPPTEKEINDQKAIEIRQQRDLLLVRDVDPIVANPLRWDSLSTEVQNKIKTYRNALLDIPEQASFPTTVTFPTKDF
tara:strand:- start:7580 stop:7990 length:411 start_codon:yes stop_codon:yes gene_type:complete